MSTSPQPAQAPPRTRRSIFPGLLLIALGVIFFVHRWDPEIGIGHLARVYWPLLFVLWGIAKLIDHLIAQRTGTQHPPLLSASEAVLLIVLSVILIIFGVGDWVRERAPWLHIDVPLHDAYSQSRTIAPQVIAPGSRVTIETARGSITVRPGHGNDLEAGIHESANGETESQADERMRQVDVLVEKTSDGYLVRPVRQNDFRGTVGVDLDVQIPSTTSGLTLRTGRGDLSVSGVASPIDARTDSGDLEIHDAGGDVTAQLQRGNVRIDRVNGNVTLRGQGDDVEIGDVKGNATIEGAFVGTVVVRKVSGTTQYALWLMRFASPWTNISVAQLTGRMELDGSDLKVSDAAGAVSLQTHDKDIEAENIAGPLDIRNSHGDTKVTINTPPREAITITNESGDVDLSLPAKSSFQISAYSRSGEVHSDFPIPSARTTDDERQNHLEGQVGGSSGENPPRISINTTYGTISLKKSS